MLILIFTPIPYYKFLSNITGSSVENNILISWLIGFYTLIVTLITIIVLFIFFLIIGEYFKSKIKK